MDWFPSYAICCKSYYFAALCSNLIILEKGTSLNLLHMTNYSFVPSLEVINALDSKLYHLLQIMSLCSILQQPNTFFEKETYLNLFHITNYPCTQSLEVNNISVPKLCHLLQIVLFCSILQQPDHFSRMKPVWINSECQITLKYQIWLQWSKIIMVF